jgi:hypothetical protein
LCNTNTNFWWGVWKPSFLFKHGEPTNSIKKVLEKREIDQKGRRIDESGLASLEGKLPN